MFEIGGINYIIFGSDDMFGFFICCFICEYEKWKTDVKFSKIIMKGRVIIIIVIFKLERFYYGVKLCLDISIKVNEFIKDFGFVT